MASLSRVRLHTVMELDYIIIVSLSSPQSSKSTTTACTLIFVGLNVRIFHRLVPSAKVSSVKIQTSVDMHGTMASVHEFKNVYSMN